VLSTVRQPGGGLLKLQAEWESNWNASDAKEPEALAGLTEAFGENAAKVVGRWWAAPFNYPVWWLKQGLYPEGPPSIPFGGGAAAIAASAAVRYPRPPPKMG